MSSIPTLSSTEFFQHGTLFATQMEGREEKFAYWFENMINQACGDLFDNQGDVKSSSLRADKINSLLHAEDREIIKKRLLRDYCENLLGEYFGSEEHPSIFKTLWHSHFDALLQNSITIAEYMQRRADKEWLRVCELWRWTKHCAEAVIEQPYNFCEAIQYLGYSIFHYLSIQNNAYINVDMLTEINEELAKTMGQFKLSKKQALMLVKLQNSFNNQQNPHSRALELKFLFAKNPSVEELCSMQFTLITQFFLFNVCVGETYSKEVNIALLQRQFDTHPAVIQFLSKSHFFYYSAHEKEDNLFVRVKKQLKQIKSINFPELNMDDCIQIMIPIRQMILYWSINNNECIKQLNSKVNKALEILFLIDKTLQKSIELEEMLIWKLPEIKESAATISYALL